MVKIERSIKIAFKSIKSSLVPIYFTLFLGFLIVLGYYFIPEIKTIFNKIILLKAKNSYIFSFVLGATFGSILPWCVKMFWKEIRPKSPLVELIFFICMWGVGGVICNFFYSIQSKIWGEEIVWYSIMGKVFTDQFIYTPFYASIYNTFSYFFARHNFSIQESKKNCPKRWYSELVLPNYITNLMVWIPGTVVIYLLPTELQIIMVSFINFIFAIILTFIAKNQNSTGRE